VKFRGLATSTFFLEIHSDFLFVLASWYNLIDLLFQIDPAGILIGWLMVLPLSRAREAGKCSPRKGICSFFYNQGICFLPHPVSIVGSSLLHLTKEWINRLTLYILKQIYYITTLCRKTYIAINIRDGGVPSFHLITQKIWVFPLNITLARFGKQVWK
jgi:hypothetical protein